MVIQILVLAYNEAVQREKEMSDLGDTEEEILKVQQKNLKRQHPVSHGLKNQCDLRNEIKVRCINF